MYDSSGWLGEAILMCSVQCTNVHNRFVGDVRLKTFWVSPIVIQSDKNARISQVFWISEYGARDNSSTLRSLKIVMGRALETHSWLNSRSDSFEKSQPVTTVRDLDHLAGVCVKVVK